MKTYYQFIKETVSDEIAIKDYYDSVKSSSIQFAAQDGDLELVKEFLRQGVPIEEEDNWGETALIRAARFNHFKVVEYLIEQGAKVNHQNDIGKTPLMESINVNQKEKSFDYLLPLSNLELKVKENDIWLEIIGNTALGISFINLQENLHSENLYYFRQLVQAGANPRPTNFPPFKLKKEGFQFNESLLSFLNSKKGQKEMMSHHPYEGAQFLLAYENCFNKLSEIERSHYLEGEFTLKIDQEPQYQKYFQTIKGSKRSGIL
jgi:hypothetical protein